MGSSRFCIQVAGLVRGWCGQEAWALGVRPGSRLRRPPPAAGLCASGTCAICVCDFLGDAFRLAFKNLISRCKCVKCCSPTPAAPWQPSSRSQPGPDRACRLGSITAAGGILLGRWRPERLAGAGGSPGPRALLLEPWLPPHRFRSDSSSGGAGTPGALQTQRLDALLSLQFAISWFFLTYCHLSIFHCVPGLDVRRKAETWLRPLGKRGRGPHSLPPPPPETAETTGSRSP